MEEVMNQNLMSFNAARFASKPVHSVLYEENYSLSIESEDARSKLAAWQHEYNTERPHSLLGYRSPIQSEPELTNDEATAA